MGLSEVKFWGPGDELFKWREPGYQDQKIQEYRGQASLSKFLLDSEIPADLCIQDENMPI